MSGCNGRLSGTPELLHFCGAERCGLPVRLFGLNEATEPLRRVAIKQSILDGCATKGLPQNNIYH